jgi:hypothetical protein
MVKKNKRIGFGRWQEEEDNDINVGQPKEEFLSEAEKRNQENLEHLMKVIRENYQPAANIQEADFFLTTVEMCQRLQDIYGELDENLLYEALREAGYKLHDVGQMKMAWLLKEAI